MTQYMLDFEGQPLKDEDGELIPYYAYYDEDNCN